MAAQQALQAATVPAYWSIGQVFTGQGPRELFRTKRGGQIYKRYMSSYEEETALHALCHAGRRSMKPLNETPVCSILRAM